jgi:hypothetical protein
VVSRYVVCVRNRRMTSTNKVVDASSLLATGDGEDVELVCCLCLDKGADKQLQRDCEMPDLSISSALRDTQQTKVSGLVR